MRCIIRADEICVYDAVHQIIIMPYIHNIYYAVYYSLTDSIHSSINPFNKYAKKIYNYSSEIDILLLLYSVDLFVERQSPTADGNFVT